MKKKPNCKEYDNCIGCKYLKVIVAKIKDENDKIKDEELAICEYNGTVDELFSNKFEDWKD